MVPLGQDSGEAPVLVLALTLVLALDCVSESVIFLHFIQGQARGGMAMLGKMSLCQ